MALERSKRCCLAVSQDLLECGNGLRNAGSVQCAVLWPCGADFACHGILMYACSQGVPSRRPLHTQPPGSKTWETAECVLFCSLSCWYCIMHGLCQSTYVVQPRSVLGEAHVPLRILSAGKVQA